ncbi:MAG: PepSY-like domain-containing protein [Bacteroidota bacterium]|nr:PepSY-like domain-containing protein [Bacteroidota bacterium]
MKILLTATLALGLVNADAQIKVPEAAQQSLVKKFQKPQHVQWEKEGDDYEAGFIWNDKRMSAVFDAKGNFKEKEETIPGKEIPAKAMSYFQQNYKKTMIKETARITNSENKITYEIGIKGKDILFDANGNFIRENKD